MSLFAKPNDIHQSDLLSLPHDKFKKKTYKYALNIVDVASRYKGSYQLTSKYAKEVAQAFQWIYENTPLNYPKTLIVNDGKEFYGDMTKLMEKHDVIIQCGDPSQHHSQGIVERFNRTTNAEAAGTLEKVGVINNLGHSLWEQIVLLINDTKVTESSNNYAYKAMLETLLSYDDVDEKSVLRLSCFKKDHGNVTADCPTATHANSGLVACSRYFEGGKKVTLITRPRIDLCQQPRYIPDLCKMLLKLTPNKSSFVLMSDKNDAK